MSSCFNRDGHARQLQWTACLLAMLACGTAQGQYIDGGEPYVAGPQGGEPYVAGTQGGEPYVVESQGRVFTGTTPLRIWHRTEGYGQEASETAIGGRAAVDLADAVGFLDGQFRISNESRGGGNLGGGFRWINDSVLTGAPRILGVSGWYDGQETQLDNYFNQLGVSFESLGESIDLRLNANIPLEDQKVGDDTIITNTTGFSEFSIGQLTLTPTDVSLRVVDFEAAARILGLNAWAYGGGYQMDGDGVSETGAKGGFRGYVTNDLALDLGVTDDPLFGTNTVLQAIWTPGRTGAGPTSWVHTLGDRMREQVYRNNYIATRQVQTAGFLALTDAAGEALTARHVDSNAAFEGDGSAARPHMSLTAASAASQPGELIIVHANSAFNGQQYVVKDEQRVLGEGAGNTHTIVTAELGSITLPETSPGALNGLRPIISNGAALDSILLAGTNGDVSTFSAMEISNFDFVGGNSAIDTTSGVGAVNINRVAISDTAAHAIDLTPLVENLSGGTTRVRFQPTISQVTFTNIGDGAGVGDADNIHLDATTAQPATTPIVENIAISQITSTNAANRTDAGVGVNLIATKRAVSVNTISWDGGNTGDGALRIAEAGVTGTPSVVTLTNGNFSNGDGFGIQLVNGVSNHIATNTTITNTGGSSIQASGGTAGLTYTGTITQDNDLAAVVDVMNGHDGNLTFNALVAGGDVITATDGNGLQFDDADGVYTFNGGVVLGVLLDTVDAGINVTGDSSGVLTFQDATITNATGVAVNFNAGTANMTYTGMITQTVNNVAVLTVGGGHDGTLVFNEMTAGTGVISATTGTGLQFEDADGAYTFNDLVTLNGGDAGIDVLAGTDAVSGSEGTFTFADADITNPTGTALNIVGNDLTAFTITGDIVDDTGRAVAIEDNLGGSITINSTITGTGVASTGILVDDNTDTTIRFAGQTTLSTDANDAVTVTDNANGGVRFDAIDLTTISGVAFNSTNTDNLTVQGAGNTITTTSGVGLNLNDVAAGAAGVTFESIDVSAGLTNGIVLNDVRTGAVTVGGAGLNPGDGGTIATSGIAVSITNAARVSINNMTLSSTAAQAVDYNVTTAPESRLLLNNNDIDNTAAGALESVRMNVSGAATLANVTLRANDIRNTSDDEAVLLTTSGVTLKTVNLLVENNENISNDSANAAMAAANFQAGGSTTLNATVRGNQFENTGGATGRPFEMASNGAAMVRLDLNSNTGIGAGDDFFLAENAGTFTVEDLAGTAAETRNTGDVNFFPNQAAFTEEAGVIPTPAQP